MRWFILCCIVGVATTVAWSQESAETVDSLNVIRPLGEEEPIKYSVTTYKEYTVHKTSLIVGSKKVATEAGEFLQVRESATQKWWRIPTIAFFKYEEGYEYNIYYKRTVYHDSPKEDEYELLRVFSKKEKDSFAVPTTDLLFEETTWQMTEFKGTSVDKGYVRFGKKEVTASAGCNRLSGLVLKRGEGNKLHIVPAKKGVYRTEKWCDDKKMMNREDKLYYVLTAVKSFEQEGSTLILRKGKKVLLRLEQTR